MYYESKQYNTGYTHKKFCDSFYYYKIEACCPNFDLWIQIEKYLLIIKLEFISVYLDIWIHILKKKNAF